MVGLIGDAIDAWGTTLGRQNQGSKMSPVGEGGGGHVQRDTAQEIVSAKIAACSGKAGRGRPNGTAPCPEDSVHGRRVCLPMSTRVPDSLHSLSGTKEFVPKTKLRREGGPSGVRAAGRRVEGVAPSLLGLVAPAPQPCPGLCRGDGARIPAPGQKPIFKDTRRQERRRGLAHAEQEGQRARLRSAASPRATPVQNGLLEGLMSVKKELGEARDRERRGGKEGGELASASPREEMIAWGSWPGGGGRSQGTGVATCPRSAAGTEKKGLKGRISAPKVVKRSSGKLLKHTRSECIVPTTQSRRHRVGEESSVVGEMWSPRLTDIEAV